MTPQKFTAHSKDVGGIPVARLVPQAGRRTIGAWCFLDHIGPARFEADSPGLQVGAHPHTNLQTFTWMLEGELLHRDSLGFRQVIRPGQVNLMTAGTGDAHGIAHTEQTPEGVRSLHAVQLWIALPMNQSIAPGFVHYPELPAWQDENANGVRYVLTTGHFQGRTAPTTQHSPLLGVDVQCQAEASLPISCQSGWEYGVLVIAGQVRIGGETFGADELAFIAAGETQFAIEAEAGSHFLLLGGEPLPHPTVMWWNFVADSREALARAVDEWNNHSPRFGEEIDLTDTPLRRLQAPEEPGNLR
ncbi:quercetin 2,3-dioxygenase [Vandammella animalimorsus]|uniref:Quercetin 2,3-dioxygenase n=1 Tax=Vandammella animalimorsus TaxID=2029117 RepID=A0A2A2T7J7_9BURK|nr:pirin family protein [Vandammella animalimorsus]PAT32751.1 quercetin 2,3-dioxygenase [Vandammella animalimorsus]PAX17782.1 quercetin 2,3-dioxygenase [Vandammella animalimorsus]PAX19936.1 quercetin 2,3-dioxygenase [Vandammella animalimorsus]